MIISNNTLQKLLVAALALATTSPFTLDAMKRKRDSDNWENEGSVQKKFKKDSSQEIASGIQLSKFEEELPKEITAYIVQLALSRPKNLIDTIKKIHSLCITSPKNLILGLQCNVANKRISLANLGNFHNLCETGDLDSVMIILAVAGNNAIELLKKKDVYSSGNRYTSWIIDSAYTPLHFAVEKEHEKITRILLLAAGRRACEVIPIFSGSDQCGTPIQASSLSLAVAKNNISIVHMMLEALGNDAWKIICLKNKNGKNALDCAQEGNHWIIMALFHIESLKRQARNNPFIPVAAEICATYALALGAYYFS